MALPDIVVSLPFVVAVRLFQATAAKVDDQHLAELFILKDIVTPKLFVLLSFLLERKNSPIDVVTAVEGWVAKAKNTGSQLKREGSWVQESWCCG